MTRLRVNDVQFNIETSGAGTPLVLLHGFTGSTQTWAQHIPALSEHHQVIAVDLLGHGQTESPDDPKRYNVECCSDDLDALFDELGLDHLYLLGYSMGGRVALHYALTYPERLIGLILESASPGIADPQERQARIVSDAELAQRIDEDGLESFVNAWERLPLFASQATLPQEVRDGVRRERLENNPRGLANSLRGLSTGARPPVWNRLYELTMPTLLIAGALDMKFSEIGQGMAASIPNARLKLVRDAGHTVHLEQPTIFDQLVIQHTTTTDGNRYGQ